MSVALHAIKPKTRVFISGDCDCGYFCSGTASITALDFFTLLETRPYPQKDIVVRLHMHKGEVVMETVSPLGV